MPIAYLNNDHVIVQDVEWKAQSASQPYSLSVDKGIYRFQIKTGDRWPEDPPDGRQRSELRATNYIPYGAKVDASFAVKIDPGPVTDRYFIIPFQIHTDDTMKVSPVLSLNIQPTKNHAREVLDIDLNNGSKEHQSHRSLKAAAPFTRGVVHRFHVTFVDSHGAPTGGSAKVWMDGKLIANFTGTTGFTEAVQEDYAKFGVYAGPATQPADKGIVSTIYDPVIKVIK